MADISCPECRKIDPSKAIDRVEKVSAIARSGTPLGQDLSLPFEPILPKMRQFTVPPEPIIGYMPVGEWTFKGIVIISFIGGLLPGLAIWTALGARQDASVVILPISLIVCGSIPFTILLNRAKKRPFEQAMQEYERSVKQQESAEQDYNAARTRYDQKQKQYRDALARWTNSTTAPDMMVFSSPMVARP